LLFVLFSAILAWSAIAMLRGRRATEEQTEVGAFTRQLKLSGSYFDDAAGTEISYEPARARLGLLLMLIAGTVSGLLGSGSGALKVPAMDLARELPIKVSSATSNFMIGVTAAASAGVYFTRGQIDPILAAPVALGVLAGAMVGANTLGRIGSRTVRAVFV